MSNVITRAKHALGAALKALSINWPTSGLRSLLLWGSQTESYVANVNPWRSSAVMACVDWLCRTYPEATLQVQQRDQDGQWQALPAHPMLDLLETPNPYYGGPLLIAAVLADRMITGNGYLYKLRAGVGRPVQLWWLPSYLVEPKREYGSTDYVSYYEYSPGGESVRLPVADVVHLRYGLDPENVMRGRSPLVPLLREIFTDEEAGRYAAALLHNMGVPPVVLSPEGNGYIDLEDGAAVKADWQAKTTGDRRGEAIIIPSAVKVQVLGFSPGNMDLGAIRNIPEERVSAVLGIPAAVIGFGTGVQQTKVGATARELREQAYEGCLIPAQRQIASELQSQLLPDFSDARGLRVAYDYSGVRALQEDENARWARYDLAYRGGWVMRAEARRAVNLPVTPEDEVYLLPMSVEMIGPGAPEPEPVPPALAAANEPLALPPGEPEEEPEEEAPEEAAKAFKAFSPDSKERIGALFVKRVTARETRFQALMREHFAAQKAALLAALDGAKARKDVAEIIDWDAWRAKLAKAGKKLVQLTLLEAAEEAIADYALGISFDLHNPRVTQWIGDRLRRFSTDVTATTKDAISEQLQAGEAAGESIPELAKRVEGYFDRNAESRSELVARTEVVGASNRGALEAYGQAGVPKKAWLATLDDRTRDDHLAADGQEVPLDQPFEVGGELLYAPGDGSPAQACNCRCTVLPISED